MDSWHAYPSVFALGHKLLKDLLLDPVLVQEKVDGSQFSFGLFADGYRARSKGAVLNLIAPDKMFARGCEIVQGLPLHEGWTYRGEYLCKPKHNALAYDRVPRNHIILFDINTGHEEYLSPEAVHNEAERLGLDAVPTLFYGLLQEVGFLRDLLEAVSCLGGQKIEGVVVKNYQRFGPDHKVLMGKFVSEAFKETHSREWRAANPNRTDVVEALIVALRTPARWAKAVQHLQERGALENSPRDIGLLYNEVPADIQKEEADFIKEKLFEWAWPKIHRGTTAGLAEWYKEQLLKQQFDGA